MLKARTALASNYLLSRLILIVAAVAAPLIILLAVSMAEARRDAERLAFSLLKSRADKVSETVFDVLEQADHLLVFMAARPGVRQLSPQACENLLGGTSALADPAYTNIGLLSAQGSMVCAARSERSQQKYSDQPWFRAGMAAPGLWLSDPIRGALTRRMVLYLTRPVMDANGQRVGLLAISLDLADINRKLSALVDGPDTSVGIRQPGRIFVTRLPDAEKWMGQPLPPSLLEAQELQAAPVHVGVGVGGLHRAFAMTVMPKYGLEAVAGMPGERVYAEANAEARRSAVAAAIAILFGVAVAILIARRVAGALGAVAATAQALSEGDTHVRVAEGLPGEFGNVAREFNRLMDRNDERAAQLRASNEEAVCLRQFYETLSQASQAIAHRSTSEALFDVVCCAATRSGLAAAAWVAAPDGDAYAIRAHAGTDDRTLPLARALVLQAMAAEGPSVHSVSREGDWISVPFATGGRPAGALLLKASAQGSYGQEVAALLAELGRDLSFGLDLERHRESEAALASAEAANKAKSTFLSHVSHELKTPLNAVLGFAQLARDTPSARRDAEVSGFLAQVLAAGNQLKRIIDDLMDVSLIEAGGVSLEKADVDAADLVRTTVAQQELSAQALKVALRTDVPAGPLMIHTDPVRLRQIITNLLSNALKYNRPGGSVSVAVKVAGDRLELRLEDTGQGMSAEQLRNLYQAFNRLGRERSAIEGTGIGLFITKRLVDLLGGTLDFASTEHVGTVVTLRLPYQPDVQAARPEPEKRRAAGHNADLAGHLVYIEDDPVNALLVEQWSKRFPALTLSVATTGEAGIALCDHHRPDLVLLDMQLPDMDGLQVLKRLGADSDTANLPVVAFSANTMPADIQEALNAGAVAYWHKPVDFALMETEMAKLLRPREAPGQAT